MEKYIAVPLQGGVLCAHFGHCEEFAIVKVVENEIREIKTLTPPEHVPGLYPRWVASFGVTDVIAGGMGQKAINLFNEQNINAFVGAPIDKAENLVNNFIAGNLSLNANYCNHDNDQQHACRH